MKSSTSSRRRPRQRKKSSSSSSSSSRAALVSPTPPLLLSSSSSITTITTETSTHAQQQQTSIHHFFAKKPKKRRATTSCAAAAAAAQPLQQQKPQKQRQRQNLQQRYLDLGQASFGKRSICRICGMLTVQGLVEDDQQHQRVCHDYLHGVAFCIPTTTTTNNNNNSSSTTASSTSATTTAARVVATISANAKIVEIRPSDSRTLWNKLLQVRAIVDQELGFVHVQQEQQQQSSSSSSTITSREHSRLTTFLYIDHKRVVGLLAAERIHTAYKLLDNNCERSTIPVRINNSNNHNTKAGDGDAVPLLLGIHTLWVHFKFRQRGIAACLLDTARNKMSWYGMHGVDMSLVAFSSPTAAGAAFARRYVQKQQQQQQGDNSNNSNKIDVLVYDCGSSSE